MTAAKMGEIMRNMVVAFVAVAIVMSAGAAEARKKGHHTGVGGRITLGMGPHHKGGYRMNGTVNGDKPAQ